MESRVQRIINRYLDDFGIGHPILEDELQDDIRYLVDLVQELQNEYVQLLETAEKWKKHE